MAGENRYRIESVYQAGQVLKAMADAGCVMGPSEIAERLGMKTETAFRMCKTLEELGFLMQVGDKYDLGMGIGLIWARTKANLEAKKERIERDIAAITIDDKEATA